MDAPSGLSVPLARLDTLEPWVEVSSTLSVEEKLKTPCVKGGPFCVDKEGPAIPPSTKVGLCERNCVSVLGN
jgi:hypothetical protein